MKAARIVIFPLLALAPTFGYAAGGHAGSLEDQLACTPDVYRLCASQIPDEDAIVACLKQHASTLSPSCHRVFFDPSPAGSASQGEEE